MGLGLRRLGELYHSGSSPRRNWADDVRNELMISALSHADLTACISIAAPVELAVVIITY